MTQLGLYSTMTPRNDASPARGQWNLADAYRYITEGYGGYHWDTMSGINADAGIFLSYVGLCSYYNYENWTDQASYVSSNTPWFFNGLRIQWFPTNKLKIEPWIINGWQSYNKFNGHRGLGGQILYRPHEWLSLVFNNYGNGTDTLGNPGRSRIHTDDSVEVRYFNKPDSTGTRYITDQSKAPHNDFLRAYAETGLLGLLAFLLVVLAIADARVVTKAYGRDFLAALPVADIERMPSDAVVAAIRFSASSTLAPLSRPSRSSASAASNASMLHGTRWRGTGCGAGN